MSKKISLDYAIGVHPTDPETIVMSVKGSGIDVKDKKHQDFMQILLDTIGAQMYAYAHNIDPKQVATRSKLPPANSN